MSKFEDFDLDLKNISRTNNFSELNAVGISDGPTCSRRCHEIVTKYCITTACTQEKCKTITVSCNCSPGDNTTACRDLKENGIEIARC